MQGSLRFRCELEKPSDALAVLVLEGDVDIYTAPEFKETLERALAGGASRIIVDMARVSFIDSTTLGVLVSGVRQVGERGGALAVVCSNENITRLFEITGLDHTFAVCATREEAIRSLTEQAPA